MTIMKIRQLSVAAAVSALTFSTASNAILGPIPIYLNTEYRTESPVIGSIASTLSFNADDIKATGANTFLDFLATVPSVNLYNPTGNVPAIFMRGGDSDHTLVLVDGISVNSADSLNGAVEYGLTTIALNDIEKVEIIKNSGSVLYGSSAISGVISITTKKGAEGRSASVNTKYGTHNSKTYNLSASSGNDNGFIRFTHNKHTTGGINTQTGDTTGEKDSIDNKSTQIKIGNKDFDISYLESRNKTEYDGFGGTDSGELGDRKFTKIAANMSKQISENWSTKLSFSKAKNSRNTGVNATTIGDKFKNTTIALLNDIKIDSALLNIGLSQDENENTTEKLKHTSKDLFINWQKNINDLDVNTGARHIKHNKFGNHTIYDAGIGKELGNDVRLTANYNTAFQAPTLKEVTAGTQTNNLKPETSKNINIGLSKAHVWGEVDLSLFKNKEKNGIKYDGGWPNSIYTNADEYSAKGAELSVNANVSDYSIDFDHTYSKSSVNNSSTQPVRRPKNISNLMINKQYGKFNSRIQVIKKSSSLDTVKLKGYTLLNLGTNYAINKNIKASLTVNNATDKEYTTANGYNNPKRIIELGLDYKF